MANEMEAPSEIHTIHPSLATLGGKVTQAKQGLDESKLEKDYKQKRVNTAKNLMSEDMASFKNKGEKMFKVLYDGIGLYEDKELLNETFSVMLEKDTIIPGTYIDNKTVLFGEPYNVYCSAINVEPTDITHSEYKDNKHEYGQTVIINVTDFDQLRVENEEDGNNSSDFVVVDENDNNKSSAASEFEAINASDAQTSNEANEANAVPETPHNNYGNNEEYEDVPVEDDEEDIDESSQLLGKNNNNLTRMPPPPTSPSSSIGKHGRYQYQTGSNVKVPPPVPSDAVMVSDNYAQPREEEMKGPTHISHRMSMDDVKLVDDINNEFGNINGAIGLTTGNILEDLDNLLQIYRNLLDERERELVYKEFWAKYEEMCAEKPWLLLRIPTRVRGFLSVMNGDGSVGEKMEPYKRDRIMRHVLSRNGLLEEPDYIHTRYLYTYFIQFELFNYMKWFCANCAGVQPWMFFWLWLLMFAEIIHIGIDFGRGNPWRAVLMECLVPLTFVASIQFVNTPFTANILRPLIENNCAALCTVYGRVSLNVLIIFFCLGSLAIQDIFLLFAALMCGVWTSIVFLAFTRLKHASNYVRIATGKVEKLREKFTIANENKDGVLTHTELRNFFKSYNQIVPFWQIELMISQYDVHRDNGLRFEALSLWFQKIPIHHLTRVNVLATRSTFDLDSPLLGSGQIGNGGLMTTGGVPVTGNGPSSYPMTAQGKVVMQSEAQKPQYTAAEKEWLGLAGKKYMNQ